jgi:hypothetical protein
MGLPRSRSRGRTKLPDAEREDEALNRHWRGKFLAALAETSCVTAAAGAAGVKVSRPYKVRRTEPAFAKEWRAALLEGYENLEMEMLRRLRFGEPRDSAVKFDNTSALRLLGLHRDTVAQERARIGNEDIETVRAQLYVRLAAMREQLLARRAAAARGDA